MGRKKPHGKRRRYSDSFARTPTQFWTPHPKSRPCRRCNTLTDPQDVTYTSSILGLPTCIPCLRILEAEATRELMAQETPLEALQRKVDKDPGLVPTGGRYITEKQYEANIINRLILENAGRRRTT